FFIFVGLVFKSYPIIFVIPSCYLVIIAAFSFRIALKESFKIGILFYASVVILHFSYGIGVIYSYLRDKFNIYWK
ncbi:MAG: hypothetical protein Q8S01_10940, partial [Ignavibacteria bacterium]|nr:hypothetical protein [Ignavibacteria bacterium]